MPAGLWLKDPSVPPLEGWQYPVEATGYTVRHPTSFAVFMRDINDHCKANNVTPPTKEEVVQWICENLHANCFEGRAPLINKFTLNLPIPKTPCCGSKVAA